MGHGALSSSAGICCIGLSGGAETWVSAVSPMATWRKGEKRAGIILDGPIVEKTRCFLRMGIFRSIFHNPRLYLSLTYILNGTNRGFWPAFLSQIHVQGFLAISMISAV